MGQEMTEELLVNLSAVRVLRTGSAGGHLYLKGYGVVPGHGECDIYAFFRTREEEIEFESQFRGQDLTIATHSIEFVRGMGAYLRECRVV
jgi:hypothetical protein